jgi:hypothetical protein
MKIRNAQTAIQRACDASSERGSGHVTNDPNGTKTFRREIEPRLPSARTGEASTVVERYATGRSLDDCWVERWVTRIAAVRKVAEVLSDGNRSATKRIDPGAVKEREDAVAGRRAIEFRTRRHTRDRAATFELHPHGHPLSDWRKVEATSCTRIDRVEQGHRLTAIEGKRLGSRDAWRRLLRWMRASRRRSDEPKHESAREEPHPCKA